MIFWTKTKGWRWRSRWEKTRAATPDEIANMLHAQLLEINVLMDGIVKHLDQIKRETFRSIYTAVQSLVKTVQRMAK